MKAKFDARVLGTHITTWQFSKIRLGRKAVTREPQHTQNKSSEDSACADNNPQPLLPLTLGRHNSHCYLALNSGYHCGWPENSILLPLLPSTAANMYTWLFMIIAAASDVQGVYTGLTELRTLSHVQGQRAKKVKIWTSIFSSGRQNLCPPRLIRGNYLNTEVKIKSKNSLYSYNMLEKVIKQNKKPNPHQTKLNQSKLSQTKSLASK